MAKAYFTGTPPETKRQPVTLELDPDEALAVRTLTYFVVGGSKLREAADRVWQTISELDGYEVRALLKEDTMLQFSDDDDA